MRKEIIYAILMGVIFGLIVAFGVIRANKAINKSSSEIATSNENQDISPTPGYQILGISLTKPQDMTIETENPVIFSGISKPQTWITVTFDDSDYILQTDEKGEFSKEIELEPSLNEILLTAIDGSGTTIEKNIKIVFSSEFKKENSEDDNTASSTNSAADVEKKVDQKITEVLNRPTFYTGTITDINNSSFQLKTDSGEIKQVSTGENTTFVKYGKTSTSLKFKDVAIGDYIIAMGYIKVKDVLTSSRVLITSPFQPDKKLVYLGKIIATKKGQITITSNGKELEIIPTDSTKTTEGDPKNMKSVRFSSITEGDTILVIGKEKDSQIEASRIHIISSEPTPTATKKP